MARRDYYDDPAAPRPNSIVPAVTAFVTDDQHRLLLVHRTDNDRWALPGGAIELGESVAQTAIREVREETGINIEVTGMVGIYSDPRHIIAYDDGEIRQQFAICVRARPLGGTLSADSESTEVRWVPPTELDGLDLHPTQRLRIDHGLRPPETQPYIE
jgi:ADP-ribose pyrophosphatase YjhB (NUDIX family)